MLALPAEGDPMTTIRCDHDTTWSHVDGETTCDACEEVVGDQCSTG